MDIYSGYIKLAGERIPVDFAAPRDATQAEKDSAFLNALAQTAEINYLVIGSEVADDCTAAKPAPALIKLRVVDSLKV